MFALHCGHTGASSPDLYPQLLHTKYPIAQPPAPCFTFHSAVICLFLITCECVDARIYAHKKGQKERANARIDLLFGKDNKSVTVPDAAVDLLHKAVYPVCEGFIQSMTVDIGNGVKGKINITSKGIIKVARTKTDTSTYAANRTLSDCSQRSNRLFLIFFRSCASRAGLSAHLLPPQRCIAIMRCGKEAGDEQTAEKESI